MAILEVTHISKAFEDTEVLKDISFSMEKGTGIVHHRFFRKRENYVASVSELPGTARRRHHSGKRGNTF